MAEIRAATPAGTLHLSAGLNMDPSQGLGHKGPPVFCRTSPATQAAAIGGRIHNRKRLSSCWCRGCPSPLVSPIASYHLRVTISSGDPRSYPTTPIFYLFCLHSARFTMQSPHDKASLPEPIDKKSLPDQGDDRHPYPRPSITLTTSSRRRVGLAGHREGVGGGGRQVPAILRALE